MFELYYVHSISSLRPGAVFEVKGTNYDSIIWRDTTMTKPTKVEVDNELDRMRNELNLDLIRQERNQLLINSDKYSLSDFPHATESKKQEWFTYRESLRNITNNLDTTNIRIGTDNNGDIEIINLTWPTIPS